MIADLLQSFRSVATDRSVDAVVACTPQRLYRWGELCRDVAALADWIAPRPTTNWALFDEDGYRFTVCLLALMTTGRRAFIPGNDTPGTLAALAQHVNHPPKVLRDAATACIGASGRATAGPAATTGEVVIFTSGSTGAPKPVVKHLRQLDREVHTLQTRWGADLAGAEILASVSHHHIYGLLFKLLWPIAAGYRFHATSYRDPAALLAAAANTERAAWIASPAHLERAQDDWPWAPAAAHLAAVFCSGGPLDGARAADVHRYAGVVPTEIYGSSETGGIAWRRQTPGVDARWQALPGVVVQRADNGVLRLRSPHLPDGDWHITADAVELDRDGRFTLGGRIDRIVKIEGKRVSLPALERQLQDLAWIARARALVLRRRRVVIGVGAELSATGRDAYAELGHGRFILALRGQLAQHFDAVTIPRAWRFPAQLPTDRQGKIRQQALAELFTQPVAGTLPRVLHKETTDNGVTLTLEVPVDLPCFNGHFPGTPILPGVTQLLWARHYAVELLGVRGAFRGMQAVKFRRLTTPGDRLQLTLGYRRDREVLQFAYAAGDTTVASGRLLFASNDD